MSTELIVNASLPETRIALMENGEIQELLIERASGKGIVGNIYKGRVTRVLPGMQAAFVDIGLEKAAFLYVDDVFVHSDIWAEEEGEPEENEAPSGEVSAVDEAVAASASTSGESIASESSVANDAPDADDNNPEYGDDDGDYEESSGDFDGGESDLSDEEMADNLADIDEEEDEEGGDPVGMGPGPEGGDGEGSGGGSDAPPAGTVAPGGSSEGGSGEGQSMGGQGGPEGQGGEDGRRRHRRGRRGGRNRRRGRDREGGQSPQNGQPVQAGGQFQGGEAGGSNEEMPENYYQQVSEEGHSESDRAGFFADSAQDGPESDRPAPQEGQARVQIGAPAGGEAGGKTRPEFKEQRDRNRKIRSKPAVKPSRANVSIQDLLKEGQEVIVQVAKDPIATKGARLTCHISLPGRHLVCMPTIDHVGVSRRIERDEERRRLREIVEKARPRKLGFIVRTATAGSKQSSENRIKQDVEYLTRLWEEIKEKANAVTAPALVYEDLNPVLRAIRDWVNEEIDKIVVDSRYHFNEVQRFVSHFMPGIKQKIELYGGDVPIFDAYNISNELSRALERKVWLKSGGYIVVDQAEALVAIDVNTGRYVGKKSLEDTILKTNLEAVKEIAYQLRLRNCGGIIILDLIDMEKEENKFRVYRALEEELKKDRARPQILKISELGLIEMTRKRTRDTMVRALCESCTHCEGKSFVKSKQTMAYEILRDIEREGIDKESTKILIQANPEVIDALAIDERESLDQLERRYRKQIYLQAVQDYHVERYQIVGEKRTRGSRSDEKILERARESAGSDSGRGRRRDRNRRRGGGEKGGDRERGGGDRNENRGGGDRNQESRQGRGDRNGGGRGDRDRNRNRGGHDQNDNPNPIKIGGGHRGDVDPHGSDEHHQNPQGGYETGAQAPVFDENMSEEDRLAFQRAQAAQDAALAGGQGGQNRQPGQGGGRFPGQGQGQGGDQQRGGRGGRNRNRNRRGGRGGRFQGGVQPGGGQQSGQHFGGNRPEGGGDASSGGGHSEGGGSYSSHDSGGSGRGESGSEGGGGQGGGGDHSSAPV